MMLARTAALGSLFACACGGDEGQRYELDGITVIEDFDDPICAGTFSYFEGRLRWLEQETGLPRDPDGLTYHWLLEPSTQSPCGDLIGCAVGRDLIGDLAGFSHELVHAHLARLGSPRPWLIEGMAVMLQDERNGAPHPSFTPSVLIELNESLELDYDAAGAFTTYLRDRYGMAMLLDYYEASTGTDAATSRRLFEDVFGDTFAEAEAEYLDGGVLDWSGSLDCDRPDIAWDGVEWEHEFQLSCEDPGAVGPAQAHADVGTDTYLWSTVTMTAPPGWITLELAASGPTWISLLECKGDGVVYVDSERPHTDAYLAGGRYLVFADAYIAAEASARVTAQRLAHAPITVAPIPPSGLLSRVPRRERRCSRS